MTPAEGARGLLPQASRSAPGNPTTTERPEALAFLDNLRWLVILGVVVVHGSATYMEFSPEWWIVHDPQTHVAFSVLALLLEAPCLAVLFFLGGFFVQPSLRRRGTKAFLSAKLLRIGLPWLIGVLLLKPLGDYLVSRAGGGSMALSELLSGQYWRTRYTQGVYWFLGVLLAFFLLYVVACRWVPSLREPLHRPGRASRGTFWGAWASMTLAMLAVMAGGTRFDGVWNWYVLMFVAPRMPLYVGFFCLGILARRRHWFEPSGYGPRLLPWLLLWASSAGLYVVARALDHGEGTREALADVLGLGQEGRAMLSAVGSKTSLAVAKAALVNANALAALMAALAACRLLLPRTGRLVRSLATNSFGIYFLHPLVLYPLSSYFVGTSFLLVLKASVVLGLAFCLSWALSAVVLRRAFLLRRVF